MSETTSVSSGEKIVTTSTMMDDHDLHPIFPPTYRPFLDELCSTTKFTKSEIRFLYRGFKQVRLAPYLSLWVGEKVCSYIDRYILWEM
jgi:hypothetical protein